MREKRLYIVDGHSWLYRAYYAIRENLTNMEGFPTKAIFGVTKMLLKVIKEKKPDYLIYVWDSPKPGFRNNLYPQYKAKRPRMPEDLSVQIPVLKEIISYLGINQLEIDTFEADDLIASLIKEINSSCQKIIVSLDKDLIPLVDGNTSIWDPMKDEVIDVNWVKKNYNIEPHQFIDVLALSGDEVDNIPGIPSIGKKTALKLITDFGDIEGIYKNLDSLSPKLRENLIKNHDELLLWRNLVKLDSGAPVCNDINYYTLKEINTNRLREIFFKLGFQSLSNILPDNKKSEGRNLFNTSDNMEKKGESAYIRYLAKHDEFSDFLGLVNNHKIFFMDIITDKLNPFLAIERIFFVLSQSRIYCIDFSQNDNNDENYKENLDKLKDILKDRDINKIGFGSKNMIISLKNSHFEFDGLKDDIQILMYLLNPEDTKMSHLIKLRESQENYKEFLITCEGLYNDLIQKIKGENLNECYVNVELPLVYVLSEMEMNGILIDRHAMKNLSEEWGREIKNIEREIFNLAGVEFNINSSQQTGDILFNKMGLPTGKKSKKKTQFSTDVEVLTELSNIHPLPKKILEYRNLVKLKTTYADGLYNSINPRTGRIHTSFNQTLTATGRLSSNNPNLQNIPVRTDEGRKIRRLFISQDGYTLVSADYSQIDLRVLAHYSRDENLIKAFKEDKDIHRWTASLIYGVSEEMVSNDMRRNAKTINFGIIYGMSPFGLSRALGIPTRSAAEFIGRYFEKYPLIKKYMEDIVRFARENGYVTTILGRKRYTSHINSANKNIREAWERIAINTPIQGSASDIIKLAMVNIHREFSNRGDIKMLLQVHDELLFEIKLEKALLYAKVIKNLMENSINLEVPVTVNISIGSNWEDMERLSI